MSHAGSPFIEPKGRLRTNNKRNLRLLYGRWSSSFNKKYDYEKPKTEGLNSALKKREGLKPSTWGLSFNISLND